MTKPTKWHVRPAKTQFSLGIRPVWSESSLSVWRKLGSWATHWAHSGDPDQTGRMPRLIWVFTGRTCHFVGFVMLRLFFAVPHPSHSRGRTSHEWDCHRQFNSEGLWLPPVHHCDRGGGRALGRHGNLWRQTPREKIWQFSVCKFSRSIIQSEKSSGSSGAIGFNGNSRPVQCYQKTGVVRELIA